MKPIAKQRDQTDRKENAKSSALEALCKGNPLTAIQNNVS